MRVLITGGSGNLARIIVRRLSAEQYDIVSPGRDRLDLLIVSEVVRFLDEHGPFDAIIHTAVRGGRRTRPDTSDDFRDNVIMMENLLFAARPDQKILHFDSGAYYGRGQHIYMRSEDDHPPPPTDPYGLAKYCIFQRTLHDPRVRHLRIFNIFHGLEEDDRFIRTCFRRKGSGEPVTIHGDRFFDFFSESDFATVVRHLLHNFDQAPKVVNLSYMEKQRLSDIARMIGASVEIVPTDPCHDYCGDGTLLASMGLPLQGLQSGLDQFCQSDTGLNPL